VLTAGGGATSSHQLSHLLTTSGRTVCRKTSKADPESADPPAATGAILPQQADRTY